MLLDEKDAEIVKEFVKQQDISGWFQNSEGGHYLQEFQKQFSSFCGSKYALTCSSGSASIYLALKAIGIGQGNHVAVPTYTHVGSVAPIILAGGIPVFVDCDQFGNLSVKDLSRIEEKLDAIVAVHQLGMPCDIDEIKDCCPETPIVEDASHAMGSYYKGKHAGLLGDVGCFSIGGGRTKTIGVGEGGIIITNNDDIAEKVKFLRNHGDRYSDAPYFCFNFRLSELNALIGYLEMRHIGTLIKSQETLAKYIIDKLPSWIEVPEVPNYIHHCRYMIGGNFKADIVKTSRQEALSRLKEFQVGPRQFIGGGWSKLISDIQYYSQWKKGNYPSSKKIRDKSIWIDYHRPPRTKEDADKLIGVLNGI